MAILVEENPDMSPRFLREVLEGRAEIEAGLGEVYAFGVSR
jgi:hypothetical protein